jgi:hypothetical protein
MMAFLNTGHLYFSALTEIKKPTAEVGLGIGSFQVRFILAWGDLCGSGLSKRSQWVMRMPFLIFWY